KVLPHRVHHMVGIPLDDAHQRLHLGEQRPLLIVHQRLEPAATPLLRIHAIAVTNTLHENLQAVQSLLQELRVLLQEVHIAVEQAIEVQPDPRVRLELECMRRLVECEPHPEVGLRQTELFLDPTDVRLHVVQLPGGRDRLATQQRQVILARSEEHTSELQSREKLVCRLLLEKKKNEYTQHY